MKHISEAVGEALAEMYRKMDDANKEKMLKLVEDLKSATAQSAFQKQLDKLSH